MPTVCAAWASYWRTGGGECVKQNQLIVGGVKAKLGEFPHIAILGFQRGNEKIEWDCGGTLISPHFVLTAAHCTQRSNEGQYWVMLGEHDRDSNATMVPWPKILGPIPPSLFHSSELGKDSSGTAVIEQLLRVEEVIDHPEYNGYLTYYDISLLRLSKPAELTSRVLPACLPLKPDVVDSKELTVAGWGRTSFGAHELSQVLLKVNVPVVSLLECQFRLFRHQDLFRAPKGIMVDQLCAGEKGRDSCKGDSGGPLIDQVSRGGSKCEHTVVGVVSFGRGCGDLGVYTRVYAYIDWITGYIAPN
ncbi:serine protease snk-like [Panulirus ornatus]|uniref:serine protease snk-like n=1 Tax=Panulirus ornatus TaxID=150431 RepID=UPI003A856037